MWTFRQFDVFPHDSPETVDENLWYWWDVYPCCRVPWLVGALVRTAPSSTSRTLWSSLSFEQGIVVKSELREHGEPRPSCPLVGCSFSLSHKQLTSTLLPFSLFSIQGSLLPFAFSESAFALSCRCRENNLGSRCLVYI